ncbi:hypothetical protein [Glycomyces buryatensis]|uniref:hypothetical protein n=1 Tax=Glycomyces buryatensis TaxID=2570927 RepID=UPI001456285D|nr:hypothetical protein [Glycomyces buryatensis]
MSDRGPTFEDEFEAETKPAELETLGHSGDTQTLEGLNSASQGQSCDGDGCTLSNNIEVETKWQNLMSAVPRAEGADGSNLYPENDLSHALPSQTDLNRLIRSVRPDGARDHALDSIAIAWDDSVVKQLSELPGLLGSYTSQLAEEWTGDDFDTFEKNIEDMVKIAQEVVDSSTEIRDMLKDESEGIWEAQGGAEGFIPFPAPQMWTKEQNWFVGIFKDDYVHCRPPWWSEKECNHITPEYALQMTGFPQGTMEDYNNKIDTETDSRLQSNQEWNDEVRRYVQETGDAFTYQLKPTDREDIYLEVREQYLTENEDALAKANTDYVEASENINNDIIDREYNANTTYSGHEDPTTPKQPTGAANEEGNLQPPGGGGGGGGMPSGGGGMPSGGGGGGYPGMDKPTTGEIDTGGLGDEDSWSPNPNKPGELPGTGDDAWKPSTTDPDDLGGGLASGGGGGGMPGGSGLPGGGSGAGGGGMPGGGAGAGMGAGMGGGMMGGAGAGRGAGGAGAGRGGGMKGMGKGGAGAGGRGMGGGMMGGGGGRGMGGQGEGEEGDATWLVEEDDVWGIGKEEDDPYA